MMDGLLSTDEEDVNLEAPVNSSNSKSLRVGQIVDLLGFGKFSVLLFVVCGLGFCGEAFELLVLSFVLPVFAREWSLSLEQKATVKTFFFFFFFFLLALFLANCLR
jgi:hypothetical protein